MRLRSLTAQHVTLPGAGLEARFDAGEEWITESCQKFTLPGITDELTAAGLRPQRSWTDPARSFALTLSEHL
jgi:L-histidine N-alpha-methyltransferase